MRPTTGTTGTTVERSITALTTRIPRVIRSQVLGGRTRFLARQSENADGQLDPRYDPTSLAADPEIGSTLRFHTGTYEPNLTEQVFQAPKPSSRSTSTSDLARSRIRAVPAGAVPQSDVRARIHGAECPRSPGTRVRRLVSCGSGVGA
jgi:hypothetical protein